MKFTVCIGWIIFLFLNIQALLCFSETSKSDVKTIAILGFEPAPDSFQNSELASKMQEILTQYFVRDPKYDVVERQRLDKVLKELEIALSDLSSQNTASKLKPLIEFLTAEYVAFGFYFVGKERLNVSARVIDITSGVIVSAEGIEIPIRHSHAPYLSSLADSLVRGMKKGNLGTLSCSSKPPAALFLDGRFIGETPMYNLLVPSGTHTLILSRPGYADEKKVINLNPFNPLVINLKLKKARKFFASFQHIEWGILTGQVKQNYGLLMEITPLHWLRFGIEANLTRINYDYTMTFPQGIPSSLQFTEISYYSAMLSCRFIPFPWLFAPYFRATGGLLWTGTESSSSSYRVRGDCELGIFIFQHGLVQGTVFVKGMAIQPFSVYIKEFNFWGVTTIKEKELFIWSFGLGFSIGVGL